MDANVTGECYLPFYRFLFQSLAAHQYSMGLAPPVFHKLHPLPDVRQNECANHANS